MTLDAFVWDAVLGPPRMRTTHGIFMEVREVTAGNAQVYLNLCQAYEAEFSAITGRLPDQDGLFALDTVLGGEVKGFLLVAQGEAGRIRRHQDFRARWLRGL